MKKLPLEVQVEKEKTNRAMVTETLSTGRQVAVVLANSPIVQLIVGLTAVELLQRVKINNKQLIGEDLGNVLTGAIIAREAVSSVSNAISLINPFD